MALVIDCVAIGDELMKEIVAETEALKSKGITPGIATLLVGEDFGAKMYRGQVEKFCEEAGFSYINENPPADVSEDEVVEIVKRLNADRSVSGILPLRPFPEHIADSAVINSIDVNKDIDTFHPFNMGKLALGEPTFPPATPAACIELMERYFTAEGIDPKDGFEGAEICVVGHSNIVGKPVSFLCLNRNASTTTVHVFTSMKGNLEKHTTVADYVIVAAGVPNLLNAAQVKEDAVVIDVGINRVFVCPECSTFNRAKKDPCRNCGADLAEAESKTVGDANFDELVNKVKAITPVPGGVGSVTNMMLARNTLRAARIAAGL
jgi:methylenetetrahydrofolate dehydrogenase (NADP+)/methenyltetrahydrofolate cyclohydrolase